MQDTIFFTTKNSNTYFYNRTVRNFFYCPPILKILNDELEKERGNKNNIVMNKMWLKNNHKFNHYDKDEIQYYYKKLLFLKQYNILTNDNNSSNKVNWNNITPELIKYQVINTKVIIFEVTQKCNLNCFYCGYGDLYNNEIDKRNKDMEFQTSKRLLDYLFYLWKKNESYTNDRIITIGFYGGEPLLRINLIKEIVEYIGESKINGIKFEFRMTTNGVYIKKYIKYLIKHQFRLLISLDGDKKANALRVFKNDKESYDLVKKNIDYILNKYPDYFKNYVSFNSVFHQPSYYMDIINYFRNNYDKTPSVYPLARNNLNKKRINEFNRIDKNIDKSYLESLKQNSYHPYFTNNDSIVQKLEKFLNTYMDLRISNINEILLEDFHPVIRTRGCIPFSLKIFLTVEGNILPCEKVNPMYKFGSTNQLPIFDFGDIAKKYKEYLNAIKNQCNNCYQGNRCGMCVFFCEKENNKYFCPEVMSLKKFEKYLSNQFSKLEDFLVKSHV